MLWHRRPLPCCLLDGGHTRPAVRLAVRADRWWYYIGASGNCWLLLLLYDVLQGTRGSFSVRTFELFHIQKAAVACSVTSISIVWTISSRGFKIRDVRKLLFSETN